MEVYNFGEIHFICLYPYVFFVRTFGVMQILLVYLPQTVVWFHVLYLRL